MGCIVHEAGEGGSTGHGDYECEPGADIRRYFTSHYVITIQEINDCFQLRHLFMIINYLEDLLVGFISAVKS